MKIVAILLLLITIVLVGEGCIRTMVLQNGRNKVPVNPGVYKSRVKFDRSLLSIIDTSVVYESFSKKFQTVERLDNHQESNYYSAWRFYPNGNLNLFYFNKFIELGEKNYDPSFCGYRGVYYLQDSLIRYDLFGPIDEIRTIGRLSGTLTFDGEYLYVLEDSRFMDLEVFVKRVLPPECMQFKADW
jgi:hypothetical protein